jgi:hypothetical protein
MYNDGVMHDGKCLVCVLDGTAGLMCLKTYLQYSVVLLYTYMYALVRKTITAAWKLLLDSSNNNAISTFDN